MARAQSEYNRKRNFEQTSEPREEPRADLADPEEAPSTDADLDEGNTEDHGHRESFSSESDADASGLPEGGDSA